MSEDREMDAALDCYARENRDLRAEVELATMRVGSLTAEVAAQRQQISALVAEIERLTGQVKEANEAEQSSIRTMDLAIDSYGQETKKVEALTAEVERLKREAQAARAWRDLMQKDLDHAIAETQSASRAALEEAAGIAVQHCSYIHGKCNSGRCVGHQVAAAIRAAAKEGRR